MKLLYIDSMPDDLIEYYIWPNVSIFVKVWLNKTYYLKYHKHIKNYIIRKKL